MRIMMVAGEASGDLHGSHLAREILRLHPEARIFGMGGRLMANAGVDVIYDVTDKSVIGITEALGAVRHLTKIREHLSVLLHEEQPAVFVPIDFPSFNLKLAVQARAIGVPVVYYFSPSTWAWGAKRAEVIANAGINVCSVFPFEAEVYRQAGANVIYIGHPLLDIVQPNMDRTEARRKLGLSLERRVIGLLPGSRAQEIRNLARPMVAAFRRLQSEFPDLAGILPAAHTTSVDVLRDLVGDAPIRVVEGQTHAALLASDAAIICSGTATLEAAILGTPQVMVYRLSRLSYAILKRMVKIKHVALPNIVFGEAIVPELLQDDVNEEKIARALRPYLTDRAEVERLQAHYAEVVRRLGTSGAVNRAARVVLEAAESDLVDSAQFELQVTGRCDFT